MARRIGRRIDVLAKITGKAKYANDLSFPDMLYAKTVRSPFPHVKIISIEYEQAEQYPGVVKVITADHIPGIPSQYKQKLILIPEVVRYVGEGALSSTIALAIGIGIQNFPEGAAISLPLRQ